MCSGCIYEGPITEKPAGKIDERLLGDWLEKGDKPEWLRVRKFSDTEYVLQYGGFWRAFFSEIDGRRFVNVQTIDPVENAERKYAFVTYVLKDDRTLVVHSVSKDLIPETLHSSREIEEAIRGNLKNPKLLNQEPAIF